MLFALRRILLLLLIGVVVYCFWPRTPAMTGFEPARMAALQIGIWKNGPAMKTYELVVPLYQIYSVEYGMPPVSALRMSFDTARALSVFHRAPDTADQEKALQPLQMAFTTLSEGTKSGFDATAAARLELTIWSLRADKARRANLVAAWADLIGLLYGKPADAALPAAKKFAAAARLAEEGKWPDAREAATEAWQAVKALGTDRR